MPGPVMTSAGGQGAATSPNVVKIPAPPPVNEIPIPLPSITMIANADAGTCSKKVKILNKPVILKKTIVKQTMGDAPGVKKGIVSGTNMGQTVFKSGSKSLLVEGQETVTVGSPISSNKDNAPMGMVLAPSQTKVIAG